MLKPTIVVPMNREGWSMKYDRIIPLVLPCFFFNSMESLLALAKATSNPAKNATNTIVTMIPINVSIRR